MTSGYDYSFPKELIAQHPAKPRDAARLLVYSRKTKKIGLDTFRNLPKYLPPRSLLVLNDTKVIPARLTVKKESGGSIKLLYVGRKKETLFFLSPQTLKIETRLCFKKFQLTVLKKEGSVYSMRPSFPASQILPLLERFGEVPLPPYIKNANPQSRKIRQDYQAIFARHTGSVAAPTASLHFTKRLLSDLRRRGHKIIFVTLHVNLGTFAPVTREQIKKRKLHEEEYSISEKSARELVLAKKERRSVVAVGTTVVRTLESAAGLDGKIIRLKGITDLFINTGYRFKFVDAIITNFHVPASSLLMLVSAFTSRSQITKIYKTAIKEKFRLFSFGDGMFIQ